MKNLNIINLLGILSGIGGVLCYFFEDIVTGTLADTISTFGQVCMGIFALWFIFKLWAITQKTKE
jgi:hypothetical protein